MFKKLLERRLFRLEIKRIRLDTKEFKTRLKLAEKTKNWGAFFAWWDEQEAKKAI